MNKSMVSYLHLSLLLTLLVVVRFFMNFSKFLYLRKVIHKQDVFIHGSLHRASEEEKHAAAKAAKWIEENQIEIKNVVLKSGVNDLISSYMEPIGLNIAQKQHISALDNLAYLDSDILQRNRKLLIRAKGYYKFQAFKSFNPLFWVEFIIFLPREILKFISVDENVKHGLLSIKILQIIYWVVSVYFMYLNYFHHK